MYKSWSFPFIGRLILLLLYVMPIAYLILTSLKSSNTEIYKAPASLIFVPSIKSYIDVFSSGDLINAILSSGIIAISTTVLTLALALPASFALAKSASRGLVSFCVGALIVFQMVPQTAAIIPLYKILGNWHLLDSFTGVILADTAFFLPFCILILRPFMRGVPTEIEEAAVVDGASVFKLFYKIVLPLVKNGIATSATLIFILSWGEFIYAVSILNTPDLYPVSALVSQQISAYGVSWSNLMAIAAIGSLPILVVYLFGQKHLAAGLTFGAVK